MKITSLQKNDRSFPNTSTSIMIGIESAKGGDSEALGKLCVRYYAPILSYIRTWQWNFHRAEDLAQKLITKVLEKNPLARFERRDAKFRSYLLLCLKNFLRDEWRSSGRFDETDSFRDLENLLLEKEAICAMDLAFAWEIHDRAIRALRCVYAKSEEVKRRFALLQPYILGKDEDYSGLAKSLGMHRGALRKCVFDLRERHHSAYRREVAGLVPARDFVGELKYLLGLLAYPRPAAG